MEGSTGGRVMMTELLPSERHARIKQRNQKGINRERPQGHAGELSLTLPLTCEAFQPHSQGLFKRSLDKRRDLKENDWC